MTDQLAIGDVEVVAERIAVWHHGGFRRRVRFVSGVPIAITRHVAGRDARWEPLSDRGRRAFLDDVAAERITLQDTP